MVLAGFAVGDLFSRSLLAVEATTLTRWVSALARPGPVPDQLTGGSAGGGSEQRPDHVTRPSEYSRRRARGRSQELSEATREFWQNAIA